MTSATRMIFSCYFRMLKLSKDKRGNNVMHWIMMNGPKELRAGPVKWNTAVNGHALDQIGTVFA
ncbi:MAG: hypothetical protein IPI91_01065 [Flavobacteriales bacterium]|nr:hypothetical protein [Flavobacteriales bacterium]